MRWRGGGFACHGHDGERQHVSSANKPEYTAIYNIAVHRICNIQPVTATTASGSSSAAPSRPWTRRAAPGRPPLRRRRCFHARLSSLARGHRSGRGGAGAKRGVQWARRRTGPAAVAEPDPGHGVSGSRGTCENMRIEGRARIRASRRCEDRFPLIPCSGMGNFVSVSALLLMDDGDTGGRRRWHKWQRRMDKDRSARAGSV